MSIENKTQSTPGSKTVVMYLSRSPHLIEEILDWIKSKAMQAVEDSEEIQLDLIQVGSELALSGDGPIAGSILIEGVNSESEIIPGTVVNNLEINLEVDGREMALFLMTTYDYELFLETQYPSPQKFASRLEGVLTEI